MRRLIQAKNRNQRRERRLLLGVISICGKQRDKHEQQNSSNTLDHLTHNNQLFKNLNSLQSSCLKLHTKGAAGK